MGFFENMQEKTKQLKEKTQNSRQKLKVSAKFKTLFAENASKKKACHKGSSLSAKEQVCMRVMLKTTKKVEICTVVITYY